MQLVACLQRDLSRVGLVYIYDCTYSQNWYQGPYIADMTQGNTTLVGTGT